MQFSVIQFNIRQQGVFALYIIIFWSRSYTFSAVDVIFFWYPNVTTIIITEWNLFVTIVCHNSFSVPSIFYHKNDFVVCENFYIVAMKVRGIAMRKITGRFLSHILSLFQTTCVHLGHMIAFPDLQSNYDMENRLQHKKWLIIFLPCQLKLQLYV